jgi:hypothetical protein
VVRATQEKDRYVKVRALVVAFALAAAMTFSAASLAGSKTTAPSNKVTVLVLIDEKGISVHKYVSVSGSKGAEVTFMPGAVPRGDYLSFNVFNRGTKVHDFTILGKKTPPIKPGHQAHLFTTALARGNFLYKSTLDKSKSFRGYLAVL